MFTKKTWYFEIRTFLISNLENNNKEEKYIQKVSEECDISMGAESNLWLRIRWLKIGKAKKKLHWTQLTIQKIISKKCLLLLRCFQSLSWMVRIYKGTWWTRFFSTENESNRMVLLCFPGTDHNGSCILLTGSPIYKYFLLLTGMVL